MKKIFSLTCLLLVTLICFSANCYALDFKAGIYYFDNSKLKFNNIKMVLGNNHTTYVYDMFPVDADNNSRCKCLINQDVSNILGFCFIDSETNSGTYNKSLQAFLNECDTTQTDFRQTKVLESLNTWDEVTGWVFCPLNNGAQSDGYWRPIDSYGVAPSGTLPIIHIDTQDQATIASKDYYINATFWLDNCGIEGYESLGSQEAPLDIEIKGRGNYTWLYMYKKPYKIKFAAKQSPLGLDNSKHFILLHNDDWSGRLRNETGFELSRQLGMPYTTRQLPVELVLNGEYEGLYFLCEKIRVESGRVDIVEQHDNDDNPYNVSGGWLLELGNKGSIVIAQYENNDPDNTWMSFVSESPENLSQVQYDYIHDFIFKADSCIYVTNKNDKGLEQFLDVNTLARFYVIHEVMENVEAFSGSLFLYKDYGIDEKLKFGPVWDFDNSYYCDNDACNHFIFDYEQVPFTFLWIKELLKFPVVQQEIRMVWKEFKANNVYSNLYEHALQWRAEIEEAEFYHERLRWPFYSGAHNANTPSQYLDRIARKVAWLDEQWSVPEGDVNCDGHVSSVDAAIIYNYLINGDETYKSTSDIDGDGHISAVDITAVYNILLR